MMNIVASIKVRPESLRGMVGVEDEVRVPQPYLFQSSTCRESDPCVGLSRQPRYIDRHNWPPQWTAALQLTN
jgi:hypothetical protein